MLSAIIGIACAATMGFGLAGYLAYTKKKYYKGKDQSSLSNTYYHTKGWFRVLLVAMPVLLVFPVLLSSSSYIDNTWLFTSPSTLISVGKFLWALCMGGIIGVALNADFRSEAESKTHVLAAVFCGACALAGCLLRPMWYIPLAVWIAWLIYYTIKAFKNKESTALYYELVCFYSVPVCLSVIILMNMFIK